MYRHTLLIFILQEMKFTFFYFLKVISVFLVLFGKLQTMYKSLVSPSVLPLEM